MTETRYLLEQHAVVTGGGTGIGAAVATELARLGADITLMGRRRDVLEGRAKGIASSHGVRTLVAACDVGDEASVREAFRIARDAFGAPAILVNNAGRGEAATLVEMKRELWDRMITVNLTGPMLCMKQVLPDMLAAKRGRVITVASVAGVRGTPRASAYSASKHGVIGLTRSVALEVAKSGVTVNAICPGYTDTSLVDVAIQNLMEGGKSEADARAILARTVPRGSLVAPDEVANAVAWLCSPGAAAVTGQAIVVGGE